MGVLRPGGTDLTAYAARQAGLKPGSRILDAGCGDGTVAAFLKDEFGLDVVGIDVDERSVQMAKDRGIDARVMDAAALEFDIYEFDAVLMECTFSVFERQEEAVHEAYCVLKPGGFLIISDVYKREPDMERFEHDYWSAMAQFRKPRLHENCGKIEHIPSPYCQDGAVVMKGLEDLLEELEMEVVLFEDRTKDLTDFAAQAVMDAGSIEAWMDSEGTWKPCSYPAKDLGYFLMIAHKKERNAG